MATTTPNYGWAVPTSTDLVKDGATAIETLGDSIDASMFTALGTKKAGTVLISTTSFTAVASISSAANTFSATYDYYVIEMGFKQNTTDGTPRFTYRASGSDIVSNYYYGGIARQSAAGTVVNNGANVAFVALSEQNLESDAGFQYCRINLSNPNQTGRKQGTSAGAFFDASGNATGFYNNFDNRNATAADAFTITASAGTITGSYSVFGVNK